MSPGQPIRPECQVAREMLIERIGSAGNLLAAPLEFHCSACHAWFDRSLAQARALNALPRRIAELNSLDGLVVAELNAGCRQERAAAALTSLERVGAPRELDKLVSESLGRAVRVAPRELDQRVANELSAGAGLRAERQVSALARLAAPAELDALVGRALSQSARTDGLPLRRWIAIAATLFVVVGAASLVRQAGLGEPRPYELRVVHTESTASLDPFSRSLLSGVTGGAIGLAQKPAPRQGDNGEAR